jgi:hypothetical protein
MSLQADVSNGAALVRSLIERDGGTLLRIVRWTNVEIMSRRGKCCQQAGSPLRGLSAAGLPPFWRPRARPGRSAKYPHTIRAVDVVAATNKCLARMNKSCASGTATNQ